MTEPTALRILLVDDEPFMRSTIKLLLRYSAHPLIKEAGSAEEALGIVPTFKPDVILCDIGMKPMSGLDFVRRLREEPDRDLSGTPVIMVTSYAEENIVKDAARLQINGYLVKPVSAAQLGVRLQAVMAQRAAIAVSRRDDRG